MLLDADPKLVGTLKDPDSWVLSFSDDPAKPRDQWTQLEGDGPLAGVALPAAVPGKPLYLTVKDPNTGLESPVLVVLPPKPAQVVSVGANIDDDIVVDFKPAVDDRDIEVGQLLAQNTTF